MKGIRFLFILGICLICFSGLISSAISWNINIGDMCYSYGDDCASNASEVMDAGAEGIASNYYSDLNICSNMFISFGTIISILSGIKIFDKNKKKNK